MYDTKIRLTVQYSTVYCNAESTLSIACFLFEGFPSGDSDNFWDSGPFPTPRLNLY